MLNNFRHSFMAFNASIFVISFNSFSFNRFSILIHEKIFFRNMYLLFLPLSYAKINDVVRDKYGLKYILLAKCANILLEGLF